MAIGRSSMNKELVGGRKPKKFGGGGLLNLSPAASLMRTMQTGTPQGILKATPMGMMMRGEETPEERKKAAKAGMKAGGVVKASKAPAMRGCGCAKRGTGSKGMI